MPETGRQGPDKTHVQSVRFDKSRFTKEQARAWLKAHGFRSGALDETENEYRFRQVDPNDSKYRYRSKPATSGVRFIMAFVKGKEQEEDFHFERTIRRETMFGSSAIEQILE